MALLLWEYHLAATEETLPVLPASQEEIVIHISVVACASSML